MKEGYKRIGTDVRKMGTAIGTGLNQTAAEELHLAKNTAVGVGIIDAHAGGLGVVLCLLCLLFSDVCTVRSFFGRRKDNRRIDGTQIGTH